MGNDLVVAGKVVSSTEVCEMEIGISGGLVTELKRQGVSGARRIRAGRALIFPGFIDAHVHMREPGWEHKEDYRTGSEAAGHGGVTTVADMPNNLVPATRRTALAEKSRLAREKSLVDVRLYGGVTAENLGELKEMSDVASGYKLFLARSTGDLTFPPSRLRDAVNGIARTGRPLSVHCEDQGIIDARRKEVRGEKPDSHCDERPPEAEVKATRMLVEALSEGPRIRANVCHASTRGTLDLVRGARSRGLFLDCEATLHHLFYERSEMLRNPMLKTNPPLRAEADRVALLQGLMDGTVSLLVTDHAPHTREEKMMHGLSGVPGLDDYGHVVSWLIAKCGVDPTVIARTACANPASFLGLHDRGVIAVGMRADITVLETDSPEVVKQDQLRTKCRWSPYEGREFPGRVRWTIRAGEALLDDYEQVRGP